MALRLFQAFYTQICTLAPVLFAWRHGIREMGFKSADSSVMAARMDECVYGKWFRNMVAGVWISFLGFFSLLRSSFLHTMAGSVGDEAAL
jgi:hypothetical protein